VQVLSSPAKCYLSKAILLLALCFTGNSMAEISRCVDSVTGEVSFTDQACPDKTPGNNQAVGSTNIDDDSADHNVQKKSVNSSQNPQAHPERYQNRAHKVESQLPGPDSQ
jgi:hypothetical protein